MAEDKKDSGFVIKDKRIFAEGSGSEEREKFSVQSETEPKLKEEIPGQDDNEELNYPPVNFTNFILSLSTSALLHLGGLPDPSVEKTKKNLPAAKQIIDIIDMINEKTKGNLSEQESKIIQGILYELKMLYIKESG